MEEAHDAMLKTRWRRVCFNELGIRFIGVHDFLMKVVEAISYDAKGHFGPFLVRLNESSILNSSHQWHLLKFVTRHQKSQHRDLFKSWLKEQAQFERFLKCRDWNSNDP
jgi:hypothetical protein